ncbi:hypothetical protein DICA3_E03774 [Diutina catenulata]
MKLYGGAIELSVPSEAVDASQFREVPDTQEVYILPSSSGKLWDRSLIVDLLEMVTGDSYDEIIATHICDITEENVKNRQLEDVAVPEIGTARVSYIHFSNERRDASEQGAPQGFVTMLGLITLDKVTTDVLITLNIPYDGGDPQATVEANLAEFTRVVESFSVREWSLFG